MTGPDLRLCIPRVLSSAHEPDALALAIKENPANDPARRPPDKLALIRDTKWKPGRTLHFRFLDGSDTMQQKVIRAARPWTEHANIQFEFDDHPDAEIRISFYADAGSWSALGTDALVKMWFPTYQPTMNFGWLRDDTPDEEYSRTVLHEFGHMLGCIHEHQNPGGKIKWKKAAVYQLFSGPPNYWSKKDIDHNIFREFDREKTQFTDIDTKSIMVYPIPAGLTEDGLSIEPPSALSPTDIAFIKQCYPR